ncbi:MAG: multicopper oxidase family protein [Candidatus Sulfopaludibacter sp.]|nr:multicopper oxidase family protein [Candidatus Sulfopaludibacter sp.]
MPLTRRQWLALAAAPAFADLSRADITLRIGEITADLGHGHSVKTLAYNGQIPGPVLRMNEGQTVAIDVVNDTRRPEMVHWHGFHIPPEVDGAHEEGTPMVQGLDRRRYSFTAQPSGTRWYHTHAMAGHDLRLGAYSGQFGMAIIAPRNDPARYDLEVPIMLHEWEPYFASDMRMDVAFKLFSVNGRILGAGEPVRVRNAQRVLFRMVNASATLGHRLALPGHVFTVVALDGNPVPTPRKVPVVDLSPGERVDALVEMTSPGVWILGEPDDRQRAAGAGIVVEYGGARGTPQWSPPPAHVWDYAAFGDSRPPAPADVRIPLVIEPGTDGNLWAINGKSYPRTDPILLHSGARNRLVFDNRSTMDHPVHLHRHTMEPVIVTCAGKPVSGVRKDVVLVPAQQTVEADVVANNPGPSLFHCHQQFHMDFGFMALMRYSG